MSEEACPHCGSFDRSCINEKPVDDCGCNRCRAAFEVKLRGLLKEAASHVWGNRRSREALDLHARISKVLSP